MRVIRSFPAAIPDNRNYIIDDAQKLINVCYNYQGLVDIDDDIIHLDWDQAIGRDDLITFARRARQNPDRVLVGPTPIERDYPNGHSSNWNCFKYEPNGVSKRFVKTGEPTCDLFGFGMVYLPRKMVLEFVDTYRAQLDAGTERFNDMAFSGWYTNAYGPADICWDVTVVHLHYRISEVPL